jgi:hypothetical protein
VAAESYRQTGQADYALGLTESFPYQLIQAKVGGFGIKSFSQIHRENTEQIITRYMAGPEPGQATARKLINRAFRTKSNRNRGMGRGTMTTTLAHKPLDTYIESLLVHASKTRKKTWQRKGKAGGPHEGHVAANVDMAGTVAG